MSKITRSTISWKLINQNKKKFLFWRICQGLTNTVKFLKTANRCLKYLNLLFLLFLCISLLFLIGIGSFCLNCFKTTLCKGEINSPTLESTSCTRISCSCLDCLIFAWIKQQCLICTHFFCSYSCPFL